MAEIAAPVVGHDVLARSRTRPAPQGSSVFERERRVVLGARLMGVTGEVQATESGRDGQSVTGVGGGRARVFADLPSVMSNK